MFKVLINRNWCGLYKNQIISGKIENNFLRLENGFCIELNFVKAL